MAELLRNDEEVKITSEKTKVTYSLVQVPPYKYFVFKTSKGSIPKDLEGSFRSVEAALKQFEAAERTWRMSQAKKREIIAKERADAKLQSEGNK